MRQAVILAGGKGTRLRCRLGDLPKPLIDVCGTPLLGRQLDLLEAHDFDSVVVLVNYKANQIRTFCEDRISASGMRITILDDGEPKGTAGAVLAALPHLEEQFAVLYGDTMLDVDLSRFWAWHDSGSDISASLFLHPNDHPQDSDIVEVDESDRIVRFHSYPHPKGEWLPNLVNAALYIVKRAALERQPAPTGPLDFAKDLFPAMLADGEKLRGYISPEYIKDAGTPARLDKVCRDLASGRIANASLRLSQPAIFIDRDGTLNKQNGHIARAEDLEVFAFVGPALKQLNEAGWRSLLVTNQPVLARGETSFQEMRRIHGHLETEMARSHAFFDRIFMCPHHPDKGFGGEVAELKISCDCRKPRPGLILRAQSELNLDLRRSWMIGDSTNDLGAAQGAAVTSILVETGEAGLDDRHPVDPDFTAPDFAAAVSFILSDYPRLAAEFGPLVDTIRPGSDWFIGGLSRTGKSTLASVICREFRMRGVACEVVRLDNWLLPEAARGDGVVARYDMPALETVFRKLTVRAEAAIMLDLPHYSRRMKGPMEKRETRRFDRGSIIIWEGVVAIPLAERLGCLDSTIFVDTDESSRVERVVRFYASRGLSRAETLTLLEGRESDEHVPIRNSMKLARNTLTFDLPSSLPRSDYPETAS